MCIIYALPLEIEIKNTVVNGIIRKSLSIGIITIIIIKLLKLTIIIKYWITYRDKLWIKFAHR